MVIDEGASVLERCREGNVTKIIPIKIDIESSAIYRH